MEVTMRGPTAIWILSWYSKDRWIALSNGENIKNTWKWTCSPETLREELYGASVQFAEYKIDQVWELNFLKEEISDGVEVTWKVRNYCYFIDE
jgi:hypothetical protein